MAPNQIGPARPMYVILDELYINLLPFTQTPRDRWNMNNYIQSAVNEAYRAGKRQERARAKAAAKEKKAKRN